MIYMSSVVQMDAGSLAMEMAPIIMWQKGQVPETYKKFWNQPSTTQPNTNADPAQNYNEWDLLEGLFSNAYSFGLHSLLKLVVLYMPTDLSVCKRVHM